jgi:hypothetical protein
VLALLCGTALAAEQNDWTIVPGQRLGPITAKTTRQDLDRLFGRSNINDRDVDVEEGPEPVTVCLPGSTQYLSRFCGTANSQVAESATIWLKSPHLYGKIVLMKKTLNIDDELLREAKAACGAATDTETIRIGLQALIRAKAYERLRSLLGTERSVRDVPRRRPSALHGPRGR